LSFDLKVEEGLLKITINIIDTQKNNCFFEVIFKENKKLIEQDSIIEHIKSSLTSQDYGLNFLKGETKKNKKPITDSLQRILKGINCFLEKF
jgi:hypothetical protein